MANQGLRISEEGEDVLTCDDEKTIINSKYSNLKGSLSGSGSVTFSASIFEQTETATINHNLGYIPFAKVVVDTEEAFGSGNYSELPLSAGFADRYYVYDYECTSSDLIIRLSRQNDSGSALTVDYKYFIFLDKGKLT